MGVHMAEPVAPGLAVAPGSVLVVGIRLDGTSVADVRTMLRGAIDAESGDVVLDLAAVEWVDATGLAVLVAAHRELRLQQRHLVLRGCQPAVRRALALTRLNRVLTLQPSVGPL